MTHTTTIAVVGLGYVGLPLAVEFGKQYTTIGFDMSEAKIAAYRRGVDPMGEVSGAELAAATGLEVTTDPAQLKRADFIVVAVPTPVDDAHQPDFGPLLGASESVGKNLRRGAIVVYESTVYPGATEEICVPMLERHSKMKWLDDFNVGYSPERINPGDREHTLTRITKVVSGDTPRDPRARGGGLWQRDQGRRLSGGIDQGRRSREGHREHAARLEHRADERAGADLPQDRHRHDGRSEGGRHEVELPAVSAGARRRPLHRRRSVLPDPQGREARLSPAGDPGGSPDQRRHGQVRGGADGQAHDPGRLPGQGGEDQRAGTHVQGELRRTCATRASSTSSTSCARMAPTCTSTIPLPMRRRRCTSTASS